MSKFYTEIAKYYDRIFPPSKIAVSLLKSGLTEGDRALDVACATGSNAKALSEEGYEVVAIDLDETMIDRLNLEETKIEAYAMNMLDIDRLGTFDLIYCIGNSLVHLRDEKEVEQFIQKAARQLNESGSLVLQIINYDRILDQKVDHLATIEDGDLRFERLYHRIDEEHIDFHTKLWVDGECIENHETLLPLRRKVLRGFLERAGFTDIREYGSFNREPQTDDSVPYIVVAKGVK